MKKNLVLICILFPLFANAQKTYTGTVLDNEERIPIKAASIQIPDLKASFQTDSGGHFTIANVPDRIFFAQVSAPGYSSLIFNLNPDSLPIINLFLTHSPIEIQAVIITGVSATTDSRKSPVPIVTIDAKYLQETSAGNAIDALTKVPGFSAVTTGPNISKPFIRGLGYTRILTLFDGVRQDGQQWGDEHGIEIDQYLVDHAEIVKGPASLMYGSDALAGVVNLIPVSPAPAGTIRGNIEGDYQTNNRSIGSSAFVQGNNKKIFWGMRVSHKQAADYQNKVDGFVYGTKYFETDLNFNVGINRKWGYSFVNMSLYDNLQEVPDGSRDSASRKFTKQISEADTIRPIVQKADLKNYKIADIHQHIQHYRMYWSSNLYVGRSRLVLNFGIQQSKRREFSHPLYTQIAGLNITMNTATYDIKYFLPKRKGFEMVLGANGMYQNNKNTNPTEFVIPNYHSFDIGPFLHLRKTYGRLDLSGGLRYDIRVFKSTNLYTKNNPDNGFEMTTLFAQNDTNIAQRFAAYSHTFHGFSGSMGATYNVSKRISIKANVSRGYRAPNVAEISAKGVHPGTGFEQLGDLNLKPEFSLQEDIGIFYFGNHITASFEIFQNQISNYIFNQKLQNVKGTDSIFRQAGNDYPVFKYIQTAAQLYGGEISIDLHPHPLDWLHFENSLSAVYAENKGGNGAVINAENRYLPTIPPLHTNHEIKIEFDKKRWIFKEVYLKIGMQYWAEQNRAFLAYNTETKTPGYTLWNTGAGCDIVNHKGKKIATLVINISNLTNLSYQTNMSRLKYFDNYPNNGTGKSGIYNMGRNVGVKVIVPI